ncbi:hypothetical protein [Kordia sp.]|uniref:hypothetical protein n=1 Tax=Kordia sp. TaxID=1965332 RepID=UPI003D280630
MKRSLKLKKVKISKIGNLHTIIAGALPAQGANIQTLPVTFPITYTLDTLLDDTCQTGTNGGRTGRTGIAIKGNDIVGN